MTAPPPRAGPGADDPALVPRQDGGAALAALAARVGRDLRRLDYPAGEWVRPHASRRAGLHEVVIVGAGQGGLVTGLALRRAGIRDLLILDRAPAGREGPWLTVARMRTLRTPKYLTGPDTGLADLTFEAWYEAAWEHPAWADLPRIPRTVWMAYLDRYRATTRLPVRNGCEVLAILPEADGTLRLRCREGGREVDLAARRVVLANGIEGSGAWYKPPALSAHLPAALHAHSSDPIDMAALGGRRVGILGIGASAVDSAAAALEAGAASVDMFHRRPAPPRSERRRWVENYGFLRHFAELPADLRWRAIRAYCAAGTPAPPWSMERLTPFANLRIHPAETWERTEVLAGEDDRGDGVGVTTARGRYRFDFTIFATGLVVDLSLRPELAAFAGRIATWADRYAPPPGHEAPGLARYPWLGPGFELTEREPGTAPALGRIHVFNWGATLSMGISASSITGMKFGVARLVDGITRGFYREFAAEHAHEIDALSAPR